MAWPLNNRVVTAAITGPRIVEQPRDSLAFSTSRFPTTRWRASTESAGPGGEALMAYA